MVWETQSSGGVATQSGQSDATDWKDLARDFVEYWLRLIEAVGATYASTSFDRLYFELWIDSGRVIGYPNSRGDLRSSWRVSVQVISPLILQESEKLASPDESPEQFEIDAMALEAKISQALRKASNDQTVRAAIKGLRKQHDFTIWLQSGDNAESARVFATIA
jgi:hypothetical protein